MRTSLLSDVVHDFVFAFPRNIGIGQNDLDVLPARVIVQSFVYIVPQTICQSEHERGTLTEPKRYV